MTLRKRTLMTIVVTLVALMSLLYVMLSHMLLGDFTALEEQHVHHEMQEAVHDLKRDFSELTSTAHDWAAWDETRNFVLARNASYVDDNLMNNTFAGLRLNVMLIFDSSERFVFGKAFDLVNQHAVRVPPELYDYVATHKALLRHNDPQTGSSGVVLLPRAPLLFVAFPISSSRYEPIVGTLIIGRYLYNTTTEHFNSLTATELNIYPLDGSQLPANVQAAATTLLAGASIAIQCLNSEVVTGYTIYRTTDQQPPLLLAVTIPRMIYQQGTMSLSYVLVALLVAGLVFSIVTVLIIERLVLSRLTQLSTGINQIRSRGDFSLSLTIRGKDELSDLGDTINRMLAALAQAYQRQQHLIEQLDYQAHHDALTGLANRVELEERIHRVLIWAQQHGGWPAIFFLDLDRFKLINDTLGHHVGDLLIQQVVQRFQHCLHPDDLFVRMGGDEFVIVLSHLRDHRQMAERAQQLLDVLQSPFTVTGYEVFVTASIGISIYPGDGQDSTTLLRHADNALHYAKQRGKNSYAFFSDRLKVSTLDHLTLENDLHRACASGELELHYQLQIELTTGEIVGVEALIRWHHPQRGPISPGIFIPLAEESGLIVPIGMWVLQQVCQQNLAWQRAGYPALKVAVNVSAAQFYQARFASLVARVLEESGLAPCWLELEITESLMMHDPDNIIHELTQLRALGISIAIDDFGTGYSSLAYIQRMPIDVVKIDQSFVQVIDDATMPSTLDGANIVRVATLLAHSFGMRVVAEGVETLQQYDCLREIGCDFGQGYLFSKPLCAQQLEALLAERLHQTENAVGLPTHC